MASRRNFEAKKPRYSTPDDGSTPRKNYLSSKRKNIGMISTNYSMPPSNPDEKYFFNAQRSQNEISIGSQPGNEDFCENSTELGRKIWEMVNSMHIRKKARMSDWENETLNLEQTQDKSLKSKLLD
jgi:hypothetical protein